MKKIAYLLIALSLCASLAFNVQAASARPQPDTSANAPAAPTAEPLPPAGVPGNENWSLVGSGASNGTIYALAFDGSGNLYAGGSFTSIGACTSGCNRIARWNGSTWLPLDSGIGDGIVYAIAVSSGVVYAGGSFTGYMSAWDGASWTSLGSGLDGSVRALAADGSGGVFAGGQFTAVSGCTGCAYVAHWDTSTWNPLSGGANGPVYALLRDAGGNLFAGGLFTSPAAHIAVWDGSVWSGLDSGVSGGASPGVYALALDDLGRLIAGGQFTTAGSMAASNLAVWNGSAWNALGSGANSIVRALAVDGAGNLYAAGEFTTPAAYVARWNGSAWNPMGIGLNNFAEALTPDASGNVYVGGAFTSAGGLTSPYLARWTAGDGRCNLAEGMDYNLYVNNLPVTVRINAGGLGSLACVSVQRFNKNHSEAGNNQKTGYFWSLRGLDADGDPAAGFNINLSLTFSAGNTTPALCRWDGSTWSACSQDSFDAVNRTVTLNNVTTFSDWVVADNTPYPLPSAGTPGDENWSTVANGTSATVETVLADGSGNLYVGGQFTSLPGCPNCAYIAKWNGSAWSALGTGMNNTVRALTFTGSGDLVAGGNFTSAGACTTGCNYIARWDGSAWQALDSGMNSYVFSLVSNGSSLYAGGQFSSPAAGLARWDGSAWSGLGSGLDGAVKDLALDSAGNLYAGGYFVKAGGVTANYVARWSGSAWSALGTGMNQYGYVYALAVDAHGGLYVGGDFSTAGGVSASKVARWDGLAWSALGSGMNLPIWDLAMDSSGALYAGGQFSTPGSNIARWDGSAWSTLGSGVNGTVYALALDVYSRLYTGGAFTTAGGLSAPYLARWTPGSGVCGLVDGGDYTLYPGNSPLKVHVNTAGTLSCVSAQRFNKSHPDAGGNQFTNYYWSLRGTNGSGADATGFDVNLSLPYSTGNTNPSLCRWNGSAWDACNRSANDTVNHLVTLNNVTTFSEWTVADDSAYPLPPSGAPGDENWTPLGSVSVNGSIISVVVADGAGNLYVGGGFTSITGCTGCAYVAKWDGSTWSPLGSGMSSTVWDLELDGSGNLYAAGSFTSPANRVAKWTGSAWEALGTGMDGTVNALALDSSGHLYAGGGFTTAGGLTTNHIARWNGSVWSPLGSGVNGNIMALALDPAGNLYAGGYFSTAGGRTANHVARWSNNAWYALGAGMTGATPNIFSLVVDSRGGLVAGGEFTTAGGGAANRIARWNGSAWSALGTGMNAYVQALAVDSAGNLYAGGGFATSGGLTTNGIARWDGTAWNALGNGVGGTTPNVWALAFDQQGGLYAGGQFTQAGGQPANRFARWTAGAGVCNVAAGQDVTLYANSVPMQVHFNSLGSGTTALSCLSAQRFNKDHPDAGDPYQKTGKYWSLGALNGSGGAASGFNVMLTLPYDPVSNPDPSLCRLSGSQWSCGRTAYDAVSKIVSLDGVTEFSEWAVGQAAPTAVDLAGFQIAAGPGRISLSWQTIYEEGWIGFNLYRSLPGQSGVGEKINPDLILVGGNRLWGGEYSFSDPSAQPGQRYVYWLEIVRSDGVRFVGPVQTTARWGLFIPIIRK